MTKVTLIANPKSPSGTAESAQNIAYQCIVTDDFL